MAHDCKVNTRQCLMFSGNSPLSPKHVIKKCKKRVVQLTLNYAIFAKDTVFCCILYMILSASFPFIKAKRNGNKMHFRICALQTWIWNLWRM